jgi:alpha-N-acetylglucosaminidase
MKPPSERRYLMKGLSLTGSMLQAIFVKLVSGMFVMSVAYSTTVNEALAKDMVIAERGKPDAVIVLGKSATDIEKYAATELRGYIKQMSGALLPIVNEDDVKTKEVKNLILIGRPQTNSLIEGLIKSGMAKLSADYPGLDGFVIKTILTEKNDWLLLGGSMDRGTLYAVYDLLESHLGVGFFEDGDRVPEVSTISLGEIDSAQRPRFEIRECLQGCAFGYSAPYWDFADWKKEIGWIAKKKFNLVHLTLGQEYIWEKVYNDFGTKYAELPQYLVSLDKPSVYWAYQKELVKQVVDFARGLGMRTVSPGFLGNVTKEFKDAHPDVKYMEVKWLDSPPTYYINPSDPMFHNLGVAFLKEYNKTYGTDHFYNVDPYPETTPGATAEEEKQVKKDAAAAMAGVIKETDSAGIWIASGWAFLDEKYWTKDAVKSFLGAIPDDMFLINDIWAEVNPIYKRLDYFYGKRWGFSVLHSFGGNTGLHGDVSDLIKKVQEVTSDPLAAKCINFYVNPEIIRHNYFYFDLAAKLSWNPAEISLDSFLGDYAVRRYGKESAANMTAVLADLVKSVYGTNDLISPMYQIRLKDKISDKSVSQRAAFIPLLEDALGKALLEKDRQKSNSLYINDMIDISRQYIAEVFNEHIVKLYKAFAAGDKEKFYKEKRTINICFDSVEKILSSSPDYCLKPVVDAAMRMPGVGPGTAEKARDTKTLLGSYDKLCDYARKDLYELVRFYYKDRVTYYIKVLEEKLQAGNTTIDYAKELDPVYRKMGEDFVKKGFVDLEGSKLRGNTIEKISEAFKAVTAGHRGI